MANSVCDKACCHGNTLYNQNLDELEFERGIWQAALDGDTNKIKSFLNRGIDVNFKDSSGYTALHYAARNGHFDSTKFLLQEGACANCTTKCGKDSPLHRSSFVGHKDIIRLLLKHNAEYKLQNSDGQTALHKAVIGSHMEIVKLLLDLDGLKDICDSKGNKAVSYAKDCEISALFSGGSGVSSVSS